MSNKSKSKKPKYTLADLTPEERKDYMECFYNMNPWMHPIIAKLGELDNQRTSNESESNKAEPSETAVFRVIYI